MLVTQSCPTLYNPMDCSPPYSSAHGILQARILEWVAIPFFRGSSQPRDQTCVSCTAGRFFTIWATREAWIKPGPPAFRAQSLSQWTTSEVPKVLHFEFIWCFFVIWFGLCTLGQSSTKATSLLKQGWDLDKIEEVSSAKRLRRYSFLATCKYKVSPKCLISPTWVQSCLPVLHLKKYVVSISLIWCLLVFW